MLVNRFASVLALGLILAGSTFAQVLYVRADAPAGGNGASWASAFADLQLGLATAEQTPSVAQVWVAEGTYKADPVDVSVSFVIPDGVAVFGGFAGTETSIAQRDIAAHPTILDGDLNGDDQPDFVNYDDNTWHVVRASGVATLVLDGLTIRGGHRGTGAGVVANAVEATFRHCTLKENWGINENNDGAGIWIAAATLDVSDCVFADNRCTSGGGLNLSPNAGPMQATFERCLFRDNFATSGAGMSAAVGSDSFVVVRDCRFERNAGCAGGGIWLASPARLERCHFEDGGIRTQCGIGSGGGAVKTETSAALEILDSTFRNNRRSQVWVEGHGIATLTRCTFLNDATTLPSVRAYSGEIALDHCVLWGTGSQVASGSTGLVSATYSDVHTEGDVLPGTGNLDADPRFVNAAAGDLRLASDSPCIDAGEPGLVVVGADLERDSRMLDGDLDGTVRIDLGADEFAPVHLEVLGTPAPGNTLTFVTSGVGGLAAVLGFGPPGQLYVPQAGTVFLDLAAGGRMRWSATPSSVPVVVPPGLAGTIHVQEVAFGGGAFVLTNYVVLEF